ncbi:MAG: vitamin K epoxide reductase family protein [Terrimesophilobacter sp.]
MTKTQRALGVPLSLLGLGMVGFVAAFALTLDKFALLENPDAQLGCNFSVLIGCSTNLNSAQGEVFGFPNSLLGIVFWSATITVGVALLAGATFARWFWALYALGATASLAFVIWFISQSLFVLHVLCPWCMVTWAVTIPLFWLVTLHAVRVGAIPLPPPVRRFAGIAIGWLPLIALACYLIVAALAQWQLDVIGELTR